MDRDELAQIIAAEGLYTRPSDGEPAPTDQLRLRARKYDDLFKCSDTACTRIRLRNPQSVAAAAPRSRRTGKKVEMKPRDTEPRRRREKAAAKYRPSKIKLLLVAETPPAALDRYFYFEDVTEQDSLFRYVSRAILGQEPTRRKKADQLAALRDRGVFLIDLKPDPVGDTSLADEVPGLIRRVKAFDPERVILIKVTVYDAAFAELRDADLPVVDERVPFPGSGQQRRFENAFARALKRARQARSQGR